MGKYIKHAEVREILDTYDREEISYSRMVEMINEVVEQKLTESDNSVYTTHFLNWRNRFFEKDVKVLKWKSLSKDSRYTTEELHKNYIRAMLESPFEVLTK